MTHLQLLQTVIGGSRKIFEGWIMTIDNPELPEFAYYDSYDRFARRVRGESRYATDTASRAFIATVLATAPARLLTIREGQIFYRAQPGISENEWEDEDGAMRIETSGHGPERMVPRPELVTGGRTNAAGIAYLYLATSTLTAISEIRPWIGAPVSVAQFKTKRVLQALDLSRGHGAPGFTKLTFDQLLGNDLMDAATKQEVVWTDIDNAFSRPVSRSDEGIEYVPTQVLAEAFVGAGYEAIAYRSSFGDPGYNVVLFDINDAEILNCTPYTVRKLEIEFESNGNVWFRHNRNK